MFTGLIEATGTILQIVPSRAASGPTRIKLSAPTIAPRLRIGDSVAVSGVCLTALDITPTTFSADLAEETLARTTLARLGLGTVVNLELPTPSGSPLGGHVVQGHVDGVGTLIVLEPVNPDVGPDDDATTDWRLRLAIPSHLSKYVASQGSITVDGISLTVAGIVGDVASISIIPHTYAATNLNKLRPGSLINIEVDVLAKYAERQTLLQNNARPGPARHPQWTVTEEYLLENGY
jgi:riboflavin synthase